MPRGTPTSKILKPTLVETLCIKINIEKDEVYNPSNGTITKELLQEVCKYLKLPDNDTKADSAKNICEHLSLNCNDIDFNDKDGTVSAGFIEKIINNI